MIKANNIVIGYNDVKVAGPLSFSFPDGCCVMLCGPNGCGKSTLMKTLAGQVKTLSGNYETIGNVVLLPSRLPKVKGFSVSEFLKLSGNDIQSAVEFMDLQSLASKDISCISDGEFQKACIASALIRKASVILLDEPTAFLDVDNRIMVLKTLQKIAHETGTTILFSTHDIYDGERYSDRILKLGEFRSAELASDQTAIPEHRQ